MKGASEKLCAPRLVDCVGGAGLIAVSEAPGALAPWRWQGADILAVLGLAYVLVDLQGLAWHWLTVYSLLLSLGLYGTALVWLMLVGNLWGVAAAGASWPRLCPVARRIAAKA